MSYIRSGFALDDIRAIQIKCQEILDVVHRICVENDIQYSLCGGTVVGAYLYHGFLPWDDDVDLMMTRENYNKFVSIAPPLLPSGLEIMNYQTSERSVLGFTKIIDSNTTYIQNDGLILGVFLDITVYDKIPICFLKRQIEYLLMRLSWSIDKGGTPSNKIKNRVRSLVLSFPLLEKRRYYSLFQRIVEYFSHTNKYLYSELFGAWAQYVLYSPSVFENYTTITFESKQYMIVSDYIEYLRTRYQRTDFREPKDKQIPPHIKYVDFSTPYREFMKKCKVNNSL